MFGFSNPVFKSEKKEETTVDLKKEQEIQLKWIKERETLRLTVAGWQVPTGYLTEKQSHLRLVMTFSF